MHPRIHRSPADDSAGSYGARLQTLFWIALSNFVFPVIFDVAQLILIFRDPNFVEGSYVIAVNSYVSILGVLFSTIWASPGATQLRVGDASSSEYSYSNGYGYGYGHSIRPPPRGHANSYSAPLAASHLPLPPKPARHSPHPAGSSLIVPPPEMKVIGDSEGATVAWCTQPTHGARLIPAGALTGIQFIKTPSYVEVTGHIKQTLVNVPDGDFGG